MNRTNIIATLLFFTGISAFSQTPGIIYKTAGTGASVLDPNGDGYTSSTTKGFISNDQAESEIPFKALVVPATEPTADPGPGPDCGFTDIVDSGVEDPVFSYLDAQSNLLFRFRLGSSANNSKGYSILIDTDQKFGFTGSQADPNAVAGNPGFELEIVLRTNFGVSLYDVDGTTTPVLKITLPYNNYAQKSIALTTNCGDSDYFYDFFIPFSTITSYFSTVNASTPLRMVAVTSMNPSPAIGNNAVSDVGGIDDQSNNYNLDNMFQAVVDNFYPTSASSITSGVSMDRSVYPSITSPVSTGATFIVGTSTEIGATIKIYKGSSQPYTLSGTGTVGSNGTWTVTVSAVATGDVYQATATNTNEGESYYSTSVTVTNCSTPAAPYNLTREANRKYLSGIGLPGAVIKVYLFSSGSYVQQSGSFILDVAGNGSFCWVSGSNINSCSPPNGAGTLANSTTYYVSQTINGCESAKVPICVDNQVSNAPTLSQATLYATTTTLSGTSSNGASITIFANGVSIASTTASGTTWSLSVNLTSQLGKYINVGAIDGTKCMAMALSASVLVQNAPVTSATPVITGSYCATSTGSSITLSGTSSEANGTSVTTYINGVTSGTTSVFNGTWSKVLTVKGSDVLTTTVTAFGKSISMPSSSVTVGLSGAAPVVTFNAPMVEGSTSLSGTFSGSGTLKIYIDGTLLGSTTSNSFTISGLSAYDLYAGGRVTATLSTGSCESAMSTGLTVSCTLPTTTISVTPPAASICSGLPSTVTLIQSENGTIYQLYNDLLTTGSSKLGTGNNISLAADAINADATITVKAIKISPVVCTSTLAESQSVTVTKPITNNSIAAPAMSTFCRTGDAEVIVGTAPLGGNGSFIYQWQSSLDNAIYLDIAGATNKDYDPSSLTKTTYFRRIVYSGSCQSITSSPVVITVENTNITNSITSYVPTTITDNGTPAMAGNDAGVGISYVWQTSLDNSVFTNTTVKSKDYTTTKSISAVTYYRRLATNGSCWSESNVIAYSVNHSPVVSDYASTGLMNDTIKFSPSDFVDAYADVDGQTLSLIQIETVPSSGVLTAGKMQMTAGSVMTFSDLGAIRYVPSNGFTGSTSFTWRGYDGNAFSNKSTVTLNVVSTTNTPPSIGFTTFYALEDTPYKFSLPDFRDSYPNPNGTPFTGIRITNLRTSGALTLHGVSVLLNDTISAVDLVSSALVLTPGKDESGATYSVFTYEIFDGSQYSLTEYLGVVNVAPVNDAPQFVAGSSQDVLINSGAITVTGWATLMASGPANESTQTLVFKVTNDNNSLFKVQPAIDSISGNLTFTVASNKLGIANISVQLTDNGGTANGGVDSTSFQKFQINVYSNVDLPPIINNGDSTIFINENSPVGTVAYSISANDLEGEPLTYAIVSGNSSGAFRIDTTTGIISVNDSTKLDYETAQQFVLTVTTSDWLNDVQTTITIDLNNLNDNIPSAKAFSSATVNENSANGTIAYTVSASDADGDSLTYAIISGNSLGAFKINSSTGVVSVIDSSKLDYETVQQFMLTVSVSDGANTVQTVVAIDLNNLNDNSPSAIASASVSLDENAVNGIPVYTVSASDADGDVITYSITSGNIMGAFGIDSKTGVISVIDSTKLDYEVVQQFILAAIFDGVDTAQAIISINLNNVNDNSPSVVPSASVSIDENPANETSVYSVSALDADGDVLTYAIISGNVLGAFSIDSTTGIISVSDSSKLDYELVQQFVLTVSVSDGANVTQSIVTIKLSNLNDNPPSVTSTSSISVNENPVNGTPVFTVAASDVDGDVLTYAITSGNTSSAFSINSSTGVIYVSDSSKLDYETTQLFVLTVAVSDGVNISTTQVIINLNNLLDTLPPTASEQTTTITALQHSIVADGMSTTLILVQLKDINGNNITIGGESIILSTTLGVLTNVVDKGNGTYQATLTSSTAVGHAIITGTLNGEAINDTDTVTFTEIALPVYSMLVTVSEPSIPADGVSASIIIIEIKDQNNQLVTGMNFQLANTAGSLGNVVDNGDGTYTITLTSSTTPGTAFITIIAEGIIESQTVQVQFTSIETDEFFIPEGFSPDGDGVNDLFVIRGAEKLTISFRVYDQNSNLICEKLPYKNDWDGNSNHGKLADGTYYYVVQIIDTLKQYVRFFTIKRK